MWDPTIVTWVLLVLGWIFILGPVTYAQTLVAIDADGRRAKDLVIGAGEEWRDATHRRGALGFAVADLTLWLPLLVAGSVGVVLGEAWGWTLWAAAGATGVEF